MTWGVSAVVGGSSLVSGYMGAKASKDAAKTSADASRYAADLQQDQYDQNRADLAPYREVATGNASEYDQRAASADKLVDEFMVQERAEIDRYMPGQDREQIKAALLSGESMGKGFDDRWGARRAEAANDTNWLSQNERTDGALNTLSDYGRSKVDTDQINQPDISRFQGGDVNQSQNAYDVQGQVSDFGQGSRQGQYQGQNFDVNRDPGVQYRQQEQERGINRNMASAGKVTSGNRLDAIMQRSGDMASQEYGAAYSRNQNDFQLNQGVNRENYGRDTGEFGLQRGSEDSRYSRDLTDYNALTQQNQTGYGRQVDAYGRDLTQYNADTAQNQANYGRQVDAYGRELGQEGDYLNRLAALSQTGQTATTNTASMGTQAANNMGTLTMQGADTKAAAQIGQGAAWQNAIGTGMQAYGQFYEPNPKPDRSTS